MLRIFSNSLFSWEKRSLPWESRTASAGTPLSMGTLYFSATSTLWSIVADVDVDEDEVLGKELGVGALVDIDVEDLAVAAPVAAEVEDDALVFCSA